MSMDSFACFLLFYVGSVAGNKRLILHNDQDTAAELISIKQTVAAIETRINRLESTNKQLESTLTQVQAENQQLRSVRGGSVYIRWGRTSCPTNETSLIYKGYAAGNHYTSTGGGVNTLCLPDDPTWNRYNDNLEEWVGKLHATEFEAIDAESVNILGFNYHDQDIPCSTCYTQKSSSIMIPGRATCYPGWTLEYTGYLLSGYHGFSSTDYICLDSKPEAVAHGGADDADHILYFTEARCDSLSCPPYVNGREIACVVCSR